MSFEWKICKNSKPQKGQMPKIKNVGNILNYVFDGWKCRDFCAEAKGPDPTGLGLKCFDAVEECLKTRIDIDYEITGPRLRSKPYEPYR